MVKMPDGTKAKTKEDNVKVLGDHFEHEVHNRPEASSYGGHRGDDRAAANPSRHVIADFHFLLWYVRTYSSSHVRTYVLK